MISENIILALQNRKGWFNTLKRAEQEKIANDYIELLNIKTPSADQLIKNLSGGNQQKTLLGRWLLGDADVYIFDEPTKGVDIGAKEEIYELIRRLSADGVGFL